MQNSNEKMTYEQQEAQIAEKSQAFINLLTQRGILANPKVTDEKIRAARQKRAPLSMLNPRFPRPAQN